MRPITAADLMNPEVLTVREDLTVAELARFLVANDITGAPVEAVDGGLVGVVSVVDVVRLAAEELAEEDDDELDEEAGATVSGNGEAGPAELASEGAGDDDGDPDGDAFDELLVEDIMTPQVHSVSEDAVVPEVARLMLEHHLHRLLVVRDDRPVGIISTSDLLGLLIEEA